jgi:hypothetical protein
LLTSDESVKTTTMVTSTDAVNDTAPSRQAPTSIT